MKVKSKFHLINVVFIIFDNYIFLFKNIILSH